MGGQGVGELFFGFFFRSSDFSCDNPNFQVSPYPPLGFSSLSSVVNVSKGPGGP